MDIGTLCFRIDYTYIFQNKNYRPNDYTLKTAAFRICSVKSCVNKFNKKIKESGYNVNNNIRALDMAFSNNIFDEDKKILENIFVDETLIIE